MNKQAIELERALISATRELHRAADALVCYLEDHPELCARDDYNGDNARAALESARSWRAVIESPNEFSTF